MIDVKVEISLEQCYVCITINNRKGYSSFEYLISSIFELQMSIKNFASIFFGFMGCT